MIEHRYRRRVNTAIPAELITSPDGQVSTGTVRNLSTEGAFIATRAKLRKNNLLDVCIGPLGSVKKTLFRTQAIVVHVDGDGVGLLLAEPLPKDIANAGLWHEVGA